ncbi:hypothetical protein THIOM_003669 [Candidatus Thiomargarita nelsonii]|uniref:Uncharacterized protein n=1 Tax=Candidatus Thiomargarita nelsonii TaxID=1003181 RepID=A0A176RY45_9GAMM|nr:hypothetical protein THIOM_003669 [Candidatus Thiomargarita nelsonii]
MLSLLISIKITLSSHAPRGNACRVANYRTIPRSDFCKNVTISRTSVYFSLNSFNASIACSIVSFFL